MRIRNIILVATILAVLLGSVSVCYATPLRVEIDYSEYNEVPASYKSNEYGAFSIGIDTIDGQATKVLEMTTKARSGGAVARMMIPFGQSVAIEQPFSIILQMKFPTVSGYDRRLNSFPALSSDDTSEAWNGSTDKLFGFYRTNFGPDNLYAIADNKGFYVRSLLANKANGDNNTNYAKSETADIKNTTIGSLVMSDQSVTSDDSFAGKYYYYRWDVDTTSNTYKLYYSEDGSEWILAYSKFNFAKPETTTLAQESTGRYGEKGTLPTGTIPSAISSFKFDERENVSDAKNSFDLVYKIARIQIKQLLMVDDSGLEDVDTIKEGVQIDPNGAITMTFSNSVSEDVSENNIYFEELSQDGTATKIEADGLYTISRTGNGNEKIKLEFTDGKGLKTNAKYNLVIKGVVDNDGVGSVAKNIYQFETVPRYEVVDVAAEANGTEVRVAFDVKDFVKKNNGYKYQLITALVDKRTNTTVDIDAQEVASNTYTSIAMERVQKSFTLTASETVTENYEVRIYIWNGFENSLALGSSTFVNIK